MVDVRVRGVTVVLDRSPVLVDIDVDVPDGAFAAVIGPSGSGKSTLLRSVAGLAPVESGSIALGGRDVTDKEPRERNIGMVFQTPAMLPRRNVRRNVAFPLELRKETVESIRRRVDAESRAMQIEHLLLRSPDSLSRGEQQLVQIARTMVRAPGTLLLDEPFAPLDAHLRIAMRSEIALLQRGYGVTTLMATNDPDDMATLADHLVVLGPRGDGVGHTMVQSGSFDDIVERPVSLDVAASVAALWTVDGVVEAGSPGFWLSLERGAGGRVRAWSPEFADLVGRRVTVGFRTGDLAVHPNGDVVATAERLIPGELHPLMCRIGARPVQCAIGSFERASLTTAAPAPVRLAAMRMLAFDPETGRRIA